MPGKGPAIMEGPHQGRSALFEIPEQHAQVQVAAVKVVQMDHIRAEALYLPDQPPGSQLAAVSLHIQKFADGPVDFPLQRGSHPIGKALGSGGGFLRPKSDPALVPLPLQQLSDAGYNAPCAFDPAKGVQLKNPHPIPPCRSGKEAGPPACPYAPFWRNDAGNRPWRSPPSAFSGAKP